MVDRAGVVPQLLGAAVGIVLGSALLFAVVGMLRGDDPASPEIAADPSATAEAPADDTDDTDEPDAEGESPAEDASPDEEPSPEPSADPSEPGEEPDAPDEEPDAPDEEVDPASVSIQVLDAVGGDQGGDAAQAVADELREAGFDVIVVNRAGRDYDVTTVFWSEGQQAGGQQVAATIGAGEAEQTPDEVSLSDSVDVHVVVGADKA